MQKPAPPVANQNLTDTWKETNIIEQLGDVLLFKPILNTLMRCELTDRAVILDPLGSFDRMIQAGPAHVDVLAVVIGGEQLQQAGKDHVVIVVHVAEPPGKRTVCQCCTFTSPWTVGECVYPPYWHEDRRTACFTSSYWTKMMPTSPEHKSC